MRGVQLLLLALVFVTGQAWSADSGSQLAGAAAAGRVQQVRDLLLDGADVNARGPGERTPLMNAAAGGNLQTSRLLLAAGAEVNLVDARGRSALMEASAFGHAGLVKLLIGLGADVNLTDKTGLSALKLAELAGFPKVSVVLQQAGSAPPGNAEKPPDGAEAQEADE